MAGSRKWQIYEADNGTQYAVNIDESNGEASGLGFIDFADGDVAPPLPRGYKMRTITVMEPVSGARRQIPVGTATAAAFVAGGTVLLESFMPGGGAVAFNILSAIGEKLSRGTPYATDTGLTDGDAT